MTRPTFAFCWVAWISFAAACADNAGTGFPSMDRPVTSSAATTGGSGGGTGDTTSSTAAGDTVGTGPGSVTTGTGAGGDGTTGATSGSGGAGGAGTSGGAGGTTGGMGGTIGGGTGGMPTFSRPQGTIPNNPMPAGMTNLPRADWQKGLVSPTILDHKHMNYPGVLNGYLSLNGNEEFWFYDVSDPKAPKQLSEYATPNRCAKCGGKGEGEAESQNAPTFMRYGDSFYQVTIAGVGVTIWDVTDQTMPKFVKSIPLEGINYGDFTDAIWGVHWQGDTIYVGGTNTGLHVLDAHDPNNVTFVKRLPTSAFAGVSAGPLFAVGNILVITTPKSNGGIATLDISDPLNPVTLDAFKTGNSYIGQFYRHYVFLQSPVRAWDVLTDPTTISRTPISTLTTDKSEYLSFGDDYLFLGHLRPNAGVSKIDISDPMHMKITERIWGRLDRTVNDDQFALAIGPLVVMTDDQSPYYGAVIGVHSADPDKKAPTVDTIIPRDGSTGVSLKSRIGLSLTDNIELATVNAASFIVRPVGGQPLAGKWSAAWGVVNFDPQEDLKSKTTYEVILPKGGMTDLVGNALAADFKATFTTQ
jgi:hypothetical protein